MSPFDAAWRLLKEDFLDPEERTPIKDEMVNYKFVSAGPYWTLNDRQKRIADAVMDLPSEYISEEGWKGDEFNHLFAEGHENVPDYEYDRLEAALRYFKFYIEYYMADPDTDKSGEFLDDTNSDHPQHPWAMARRMAFRETEPYENFSEDFKETNKSEPVDLAWRLLKSQMTRPTRKKPPGTFDKEKKERIDRLIERERGMSLEEWRNEVLDDAYNRNFAFRSGGQSRLPGYIEHFATSNRQLGKPEIPQTARLPSIGDALRDVEQRRIADAAPARPQPKTQPARLHMRVPHNRSRDFFLQDEEGNPLATIEGMKGFVTPRMPKLARNIRGFAGSSQERRKGHYRDLIESLLRHGFTLRSDSRNEMSNPFHRKFLRTLPDDIESPQEYQDLIGRYDDIEYEAHAPFSRTKDLDYGDLVVETRSKYPMTYDTPYQGYKKRLEEGIKPDQDIIVPAHIDREGNKIPQKQYLQSQLAGTGHEHDIGSVPSPVTFTSDALITPEGIIVPRNLKTTTYYDPFVQTGGATIPEFQPDSEVLSAPQPSAQKIMGFGIDPVTRKRQQIGVVDNGAPRINE